MKRREAGRKCFFVLSICILFSYPNFIQAQNYNYHNTARTDTTKTDTTKTDTLGLKGINRIGSGTYAFTGNTSSGIYFLDSSKTDTSKTDTTKTDTLGYNDSDYRSGNGYAYNNKFDSRNTPVSNISKSSGFVIFPVKYLAQKLKEDIYLKDDQTLRVKDILREYEAKTYQAKGDSEGLKEAANNALKNIENILTDRQKKEWETTKDEWWASVDKELNLSPLNNNNL